MSFVLFLGIAMLAWGIETLIPNGPLKAFLTKDRTTEAASRRDRIIVTVVLLSLFAALIAWARVTASP